MSSIFISYRRKDSAGTTERLREYLAGALGGKHDIFLDTRAIAAGDSFEARIIGHINKCDLVIAIIGDRWLGVDHPSGSARIQDPSDWVRRELEISLNRKIKTIPVTIDDVTLPSLSTSLPESLKGMLSLNAIPIRNGYEFKQDAQRLIDDIKKYFSEQKTMAEAEQRRREKEDVELVIKLCNGRLSEGFWILKCKEIKEFSKHLSSGENRLYFISDKRYTFHISYSFDKNYAEYGQTSMIMVFGRSPSWSGFLPPGIHTFECGLETGLTKSNTGNFLVSVLSLARINPVTLYLNPVDYQKPIVD